MFSRNYLVSTFPPPRDVTFLSHCLPSCRLSVPILPLPLEAKNPVFSTPSNVLRLIVIRAPSLSLAYANTSVNRPNVRGSFFPKTVARHHHRFSHRLRLSQKPLITPGTTMTLFPSWMSLPMKTLWHRPTTQQEFIRNLPTIQL